MPKDPISAVGGRASSTPKNQGQRRSEPEAEDRLPGNRTPPEDDPAPGGTEQPKDDRRKRGDLQKRGLG